MLGGAVSDALGAEVWDVLALLASEVGPLAPADELADVLAMAGAGVFIGA